MNYNKELELVRASYAAPKYKIGDIITYIQEGNTDDTYSTVVQSKIISATSYIHQGSYHNPGWIYVTEEMENNQDSEQFFAEEDIIAKL